MPKLGFGQKASFDSRSDYLELKSKGDKVTVRFLDAPVYDGKHFIETETSWEVPYCPRIMEEKKCDHCERFFEAKRELKEMGDPKSFTKDQKEQAKILEGIAKTTRVSVSFYYPVLNRETHQAQILKAGLSIRIEVDNQANAGIDIMKYDFVITRLKGKASDPGKDWYSFVRLDSAETPELTDEEKQQIQTASEWDLEKMVISKRSSQYMGEEPPMPEDHFKK